MNATMSELFPAEQVSVDSPRLRWLKKHDVATIDFKEGGEDERGEYKRWAAGTTNHDNTRWQQGDTEDEAIANWAKAHNVPLWNEEGLSRE